MPDVLIEPVPTMRRQNNLSCGYFCELALLDHWFKKLFKQDPTHMRLKKTWPIAYDPKEDNHKKIMNSLISRTQGDVPDSMGVWKISLRDNGPMIIPRNLDQPSAKPKNFLGEARAVFAIGHYILVVGYNEEEDSLLYKDSLWGDDIQRLSITHLNTYIRHKEGAYYVRGVENARKIFVKLGSF